MQLPPPIRNQIHHTKEIDEMYLVRNGFIHTYYIVFNNPSQLTWLESRSSERCNVSLLERMGVSGWPTKGQMPCWEHWTNGKTTVVVEKRKIDTNHRVWPRRDIHPDTPATTTTTREHGWLNSTTLHKNCRLVTHYGRSINQPYESPTFRDENCFFLLRYWSCACCKPFGPTIYPRARMHAWIVSGNENLGSEHKKNHPNSLLSENRVILSNTDNHTPNRTRCSTFRGGGG